MKRESSIKDEKTSKELQSQLSKLEGEIAAMRIELSNKNKELISKSNIANELKRKIQAFNRPTKPVVSEHALLRYCERVKGIDLKEVESEILNESVLDMVDKLGGSGAYPNNKGYQVKMKNNVVITIIK